MSVILGFPSLTLELVFYIVSHVCSLTICLQIFNSAGILLQFGVKL